MASFPDLRHRSRSAIAGSVVLRWARSPKLLAVSAALLLTAFIAVSELATLRGAKAHDASAYLTRELGPPLGSASLVRAPARVSPALGGKLEIRGGGLRVSSGRNALSLRFAGSSAWRQYANGVARRTPFGREAITFGVNRVEQSLLVNRHQGTRVWRWKLSSNLNARVALDGSVRFGDSALKILPVAIFDRAGRDITPDGARWSLRRNMLELRLADADLPTPYVIDPIALVAACPGGGCATSTASNTTSLTISRPGSVATGNLMVAQVVVRSNAAITAPSGWSTIGNLQTSGTGLEQRIYYKVATVLDTPVSTYQWSWTGAVDASGGILAYSGVDATSPFDVTPSNNSGTGTTATASSITTTQANDMLIAYYGVQGQSGPTLSVSQDTGQGMTQEYAVSSGSSPASKAHAAGADGTQAAAGVSGAKTATISTSAQWAAHLVALMPPLSVDGAGTMASSISNVSASQAGRTITFTYTAASGGMQNGAITILVPSLWSAPSTTATAAGYTTASTGTVSVSSQTITVSGVTLAGGSTMTITYGSTAGGGPGATATSTTGAQTWQVQQKSRSTGTLTNLTAGSPSITVYGIDGGGTISPSITNVSASQTGRTITFTYTAPTGGISSGTVTLAVPSGWSAPSTTGTAAGYSTSSAGTLTVSGQTITVSSLTLAAGGTFTITYGSTAGGGAGATATSTTGAPNWTTQESSTANGTLTDLASQPSITVYGIDGGGSISPSLTEISAGATGQTITFTYTAPTGGMSNGAVTIVVPSGWNAPSTTGTAAGYTTASTGTVTVSSQTITLSGITLAGGSTMTITYGSKAGGGPGATVPSSTGLQTWTTQQKSTSNGSLLDVASQPGITIYGPDGGGTMAASISAVSASQTGRTVTFTYTAPAGGMSNGAVSVAIPSGWSAPSTTSSAAGYSTSSAGTLTVSGSTITVSSLTLAAGSTFTITYGNTGSGGPGATATSTTGAQTWTTQQKTTSGGTLTSIGSSPSITVYAADGAGTMGASISTVSASQTGRTITFTYTAPTGGISNGTVTVVVPSGWSAPSTTSSAAGYSTSSAGTLTVSGSTITVSSLTLAAGNTFTITYGNTGSGGPGATATSTTGAQTWTTQTKSTSAGSLTDVASQPSITVYSADGAGTMSAGTSNVSAGQTGRTMTFTYTAAAGGISNGAVTLAVPSGWSAPSTTGSAAGYSTSSAGTLTVSGSTITVSSLTLAAGGTVTITYGSTASGGPGATATSTTGAQTWTTQEKSTSAGSLTDIASQPSVTVNAADGSGTMGASMSTVSASQTGRTITFTYTAPTGGMSSGSVTLAVPSGWSAPSTTSSAAGYSTSSAGTLTVSGSTITVSSLTLAAGNTFTITYGNTGSGGPGATATSSTGAQTWTTQQKSTSGGSLTSIASSPSITVYAADGSGTMGASISTVSASQTGRTITFTYTAPAGGISGGAVTVAVPSGWSAPSTTSSAAGYSTSSAGTLTVSGSTITVSSLTLAAGNTFTITYGDTGSGGPGATATSSTGAQTWQAQAKSTSGGSLTNISSSPSITVYAADGSGTMGASISAVSASQTGRTITFTYTAPAGGISSGSVTVAVPSGWSAPSTTSSAAGYSTSSAGTLTVSGSTITVSSLTLTAGNTFTITYGNTGSGGPGATATSSTGAQTWTTQEKSTSSGSLTSIASSPSITVYAADGAGTLVADTSSVAVSSTGNTITFTYTAPAGGISSGSVTVAVPSGWSAPSTTSSAAGYSTSSAGTLTVSGSTITVSSLTLGAGNTFTIVYGSKASGGPGATATSSSGAQTWQAQAKSTSAGSLTNLSSSPSITVLASDGSGTLTTPTGSVNTSSTGNTITFTYTAATGGLANGSVTLAVPSGWSAPSTTGSAAGYTTASTGTVSVSSQTVTVSSITLSGGATFTITYGSTAGGGSGATAPSTAAAQTWQGQEKSSSGGTLTNLASSPAINVNDPTPPSAPSLSYGSFTNASVTGSTVYIRQGSAGGFTVTGTSSDPESGIDHLTFPGSLGSGWTGGGQDSSSPYTGVYTFSAAATAPGGNQNVTATNGWALTSAATPFTIVADTTAPSVTAPGVTAGYYTSLSVPVTKNGGSDGGSGVDNASSVLQRDEIALTNGTCGSFPGSWATVTLSGGNDTSVVSGKCYRYRELLSDNVGNQGTSGASNVAKVDTTAPSTPTLSFSGLSSNGYYDGSGTLYIRPAAGGTFTVTAASSDAQSDIGSYTFGTLNSNGGANFGGSQTGDHFDYTFDGTTTAPSTARSVSATNGAGTGSANATYSIAADTTAPSITAPSVTAGYYTSLSVPVTKNGGSDGGSGIDGTTSIVQRDDVTLSNGTCGGFSGSWSTVTLSGGNDTSVISGNCYRYRELLSDRVGNQGTSGASNVAKVDTQGPANNLTLSNVSPAGSALKVGTRIYYRGAVTGGGSFKLTNAVTDADAGPASSATAALGGTTSGWSHTPSTVSTPAAGPYDSNSFDWTQGTTSAPTEVVTGADSAGNTTAASTLTFTNDSNAPTGGALTVNGGATWSTTGNFAIDTRTDYTETQSATESGLASSTLTRAAASLTNNSCGSYGSPTTIVGTPAQSLSTGCYLYTLTGTDNLGNSASVTATVKVDTSDPTAPTFSFSNFTGSTSAVGDTVFFLPTSTGSFDITASSSDGDSGIASYTFPTAASFGTGWSVSGSGATRTYSYTPGSATPGTQSVSAANNAGRTNNASFQVEVSDITPPTTSIQCNGAACAASYYSSAPVSVTLSADDGPTGSGVNVIRYTIDGSDPSPINGSDYVGPINIFTTTTVKFRAYDNLGNEEAVGSQLVRVDSTPPSGQTIALTGADAPYFTSASITFTTGNGSDADSGLDLSSAAVTRETGDLSGDTCTNFSSDAGTFTSPDNAVSGGHCYRYTFTIADNVGHVSAPVTATAKVDMDNPSVSLANPGTPVAGVVALSATASDPSTGVQQVVFERSPAGASTWTTIGTDTSAPYTANWNTGAVADGLYDLRAVATDTLGHTASDVVASRRVDNTAPDTTIDSGPADPSNDATPTFTFSSSEAGSTFECRIDGGSWSSCTSPHTTAALGAGSHTFDVRATDAAGNTDATAATSTWTIDLTAPNTTIDSSPASPSGNATPTFTFSSTETGSTFECRVDSGSWSTCTSPHTTAALADGSHTFDVRATDTAGNTDATPASHTWTVDLTAPNTTIDSSPQSPSNDTTPTFNFSSNEGGSTFECRVDGGSWSTCTSPHTTAALAEGTHTFDVRATDAAGNTDPSPASVTWTIDVTAPNTTIDSSPSSPSNDTTPTFAFSASEPGSTFECRIDGGSWSPCTSPHTTAALGEGTHTFDVRATDPAGNTDGTPASQTWTIDLTAPNTTIDSAPPALDNDATPTFTFSSNEGGSTFECRVDGGSWSPCTSPHTTSALADGSHTFDVRATDPAGNTDASPASHTWSIDSGPPTITITAPTTYINGSDPSTYSVNATTPDGDVTRVDFYECSNASVGCSTGTWTQFDTDSSAPYTGSWSTPASDGTRAIRAVAVDAALNTGADVRTITIDRTPPGGVTVSYPDGYVTGSFAVTTNNGPDADVDVSTATLERQTGNLSGNSCSSYSGWTAASSPDSVATGKCAVYRFRIADNAGNWTTATSGNEVKSDTNAPTSAQDDPGANIRQTVSLTSSASDTGGSGLASVAFQRRPAGGGSWTTIGTDTTSPFSTSFDTTTVADGLYDFRTVATDVAGNVEASPVVVANRRIDNTAPSATMTSPGNPVRGTVTLTSNTSDAGSGLASVTYELAPNGGSFNTQPATWDTTVGADGLYDLRVTATDVAGNSTTSSLVTTRVDNTAPALTFSSPATGATVSGTVSLTATSSDASPASPPISFFYKLHSDPPSAYTATGASWDTTSLPAGDGLYDLRARATDDASNTTTVENTSIRVDNVPPAVAITAPAPAINGSLPSPTSFSATATDTGGSGVQQVQFFECSDQSTNCSTGVWSPLGTVAAPGPYTVSWNIPATDGNHALAAVATDNAGHSSSAIRNVDVDRTAPETTIVGKPADPSNVATPSFTFSSSESGSTFECRIDGGSWAPCTSPHSVSGLTDNSHTFDVRATDPAGNTDPSPDTWTWHRDTNSPNATINNPGTPNVRGVITLTSAENDPPANGYQSGIASVTFEYSADGTTWATIGTNNSPPFNNMSWNTAAVADGVYDVRVVARDVAGNSTASAPITNLRIDNTPPTTSQNDPGQYLRATKTLTGSAADSGSGVDHVDFQRAPTGSGFWTTIATDSTPGDGFQVNFDTTGVADGHYDFRTVAYDLAGNQAASAPVTDRLVDNTAPNATLNDPGAYLRGAVSLSSSTDDPGGANASGIASVAYEYSPNGGTTWFPTGSTFDSTSVADGNVELHVVATDAAGNTTISAPLTKLVDNTKPVTTDDAPSGWHANPVTVTLTPNDAGSGVNVTEYSVDGNPTYTVGTSVVIPAPADGSNDGSHTIAYFSVDNAGNIESVKSATVLIDATPPACPSCSAADYLRGTVTLSASPAADGSGIKSVAFEYSPAGAGTWTTIGTDTTGPAPYTTAWNTTAVADGHYDLRILITDNADNVTTTNLPDKIVDNTAPNVATVGAPTEGQVVSGTVGIAASASDVTSPIASVQFLVRGSVLGTDTTAPFSMNWDSTSGPDGAATIQIVVTDMAGNSTTSAVRNVTVDNVAPTPTLADPGQNLSGTVSLSASSDADTIQVDFERRPAGGGSWTTIASDSTLPWGTSLDTTTLADGMYDFRAVATDATGHTGFSPLRTNIRIDNTAPSGSVTAPSAGATVGGNNVTLSVSVADAGSGVASVRYELRSTGGGSFTQIATSSSAPFSATWDATTVSTGSYDLRPVITDGAGNTFIGAAVTFNVDVTAPTVTLTNPGATISGSVTLNATVSGSGATSVAFGISPAGGASWTSLGTDTSSPWSTAFDTTKVADGVYDLRATVSDGLGNTSEDVVANIRVDNTAPQLVSSSPAEGSTVGSANAISLVTNEPATPVGVTLDGGGTVAPVVSGTHIDYNTGALAAGPHTLAGELQDASGKRAPFRVHFTVGSTGYVEKNTSSSGSSTVTSSDGFASATMPPGAWSTSGNDWIVLRIAPTAAPSGLTNGFAPGPEGLEVTARWALSGVELHEFAQPIEILIRSTEPGLVPATFDGSAWRVIHRVPTAGTLPAGWADGFFTDGNGVHVLTKHLSLFALLKDVQAPQSPQNVRGYVGASGLTIRWLPGGDNSGTYDYVTLFSGSSDTGHYGPDYTAATVAGWARGDQRIFRLKETDLAGNESDVTPPLVEIPSLIGMTPDEVEAALAKLGLTLGSLTVGGVGKPGTVTGPEGLVLAPQGASIDVTVAPGGAAATFAFKVVTAPKYKPAPRKKLAARVTLTRAARVTAQLFSPRRVRLYTWRMQARAGQTILRLRIPRQVRRPGIYTMRWTARAGGEIRTRTIRIRVFGAKPPVQRTQIVLSGAAAVSASGKVGKNQTVVNGVEPTFDATANRNRDVRVIVVDADEFGVSIVRDLHAVFPSVKIVALAAGPRTMAAALRAGATVVLPRTTPPATLAKVIQRLAKRR